MFACMGYDIHGVEVTRVDLGRCAGVECAWDVTFGVGDHDMWLNHLNVASANHGINKHIILSDD